MKYMPVILVAEVHQGEHNYYHAEKILSELKPHWVTIERLPGTDYKDYHRLVVGRSPDGVAVVRKSLEVSDGTLLACIDYASSGHCTDGLACIDSGATRIRGTLDDSLLTPWERHVRSFKLNENGSCPNSVVDEILDAHRSGGAQHSKELNRYNRTHERNRIMARTIRDLSASGTVMHFSGSAHIFAHRPTLVTLLKDCPVKTMTLDRQRGRQVEEVYYWLNNR
jgi:hypothetical protein